MKVKNITEHLVIVDGLYISPGQVVDIPKDKEASINKKELKPVDWKSNIQETNKDAE